MKRGHNIGKYAGLIMNEDVLKIAYEHVYLIPTIKKRKCALFGHLLRRNHIHRLIFEGSLEEKLARGRPITEEMTNIKRVKK